MTTVYIKESESFDFTLRRFKRICEKSGIFAEMRKREYYEKPATLRKRAMISASRRYKKKLIREKRNRTRLF